MTEETLYGRVRQRFPRIVRKGIRRIPLRNSRRTAGRSNLLNGDGRGPGNRRTEYAVKKVRESMRFPGLFLYAKHTVGGQKGRRSKVKQNSEEPVGFFWQYNDSTAVRPARRCFPTTGNRDQTNGPRFRFPDPSTRRWFGGWPSPCRERHERRYAFQRESLPGLKRR